LNFFSHSETSSYDESIFDCRFCHKKYRGFLGTDSSVLQHRLQFSDLVLSDLVRMFSNIHRSSIIDAVIDNVIGMGQLIKKGQKLRAEELDISFILNNKRAYLHCKVEGNNLKVISVNEV
jgi:hypothetical protein